MKILMFNINSKYETKKYFCITFCVCVCVCVYVLEYIFFSILPVIALPNDHCFIKEWPCLAENFRLLWPKRME